MTDKPVILLQASVAVWQDVTGKAKEKAVALSMAVGCGYAYETTFEKEVYSDLYGERGCLMGGIREFAAYLPWSLSRTESIPY